MPVKFQLGYGEIVENRILKKRKEGKNIKINWLSGSSKRINFEVTIWGFKTTYNKIIMCFSQKKKYKYIYILCRFVLSMAFNDHIIKKKKDGRPN